MSIEQADLFELYLIRLDFVCSAKVYERTGDAVIFYKGDRGSLIDALARFKYENNPLADKLPEQSTRQLNAYYKGKLADMVIRWVVRNLFMPAPWRTCHTLFSSVKYFSAAIKCLSRGHLRIEVLDALSVGISMVQGNFGTAGSVMFLLSLGELIEEWTRKKSVGDLARRMAIGVDRVWKKTDEGDELVAVCDIVPGDLIHARAGNMIALDGRVVEGDATANQASLTGESVPIPKRPGSPVYAGTVLEEGGCIFEVSAQMGGSRYDRVVNMIEESQKLQSVTETEAASLADRLVPYSLIGTVLTYLFTRNITRAVSILMVDFSCALKLSMPLSFLSAMSEAGKYHITVKGAKYLEAMAKADTIIFDKTGTLTKACPTVVDVVAFGNNAPGEMLRLAACLEEHYPHSIANAVVDAAKKANLKHEEMHAEEEYLVAHGIASKVDGKRVVIGSYHFVLEDEKCIVPEDEREKFDSLPADCSHLFLAIGGKLAAAICVADPPRPEASAVLKSLRELGIKRMVMMTGDSKNAAAAIAESVGVDEYHAEVLPEDKAAYVKAEQDAGHTVIMIGDGINDSPALAVADVGIAISDGAAIAREIADITVAADDLSMLATLRKLSVMLMKRVGRNYRFVLGFNGTLIVLGAAGAIMPTTSALLHNISTIAVSLESMTPLLRSDK